MISHRHTAGTGAPTAVDPALSVYADLERIPAAARADCASLHTALAQLNPAAAAGDPAVIAAVIHLPYVCLPLHDLDRQHLWWAHWASRAATRRYGCDSLDAIEALHSVTLVADRVDQPVQAWQAWRSIAAAHIRRRERTAAADLQASIAAAAQRAGHCARAHQLAAALAGLCRRAGPGTDLYLRGRRALPVFIGILAGCGHEHAARHQLRGYADTLAAGTLAADVADTATTILRAINAARRGHIDRCERPGRQTHQDRFSDQQWRALIDEALAGPVLRPAHRGTVTTTGVGTA